MTSSSFRPGSAPDPFQGLVREIKKGIVLHLDPDVLESCGGVPTGRPECRVRGVHFFVCVRHLDGFGMWMPLFSEPGICRVELPAAGRQGHFKWRTGTSHIHLKQAWSASDLAVVRAAHAGNELSRPGARNWADPVWCDEIAVWQAEEDCA